MNYQFQTENSLRGCVFIDSSNPEFPNQVINHSSHPFIKPSFPPLIDPKDLLIISKDNKPSRSPNAFIIYRKVYLKTTRDLGYFLPMTIVSSMASKSWDQETEEVRSHYKHLAKEAYKYRTEQFPKKIKRRRRKEPWKTNKIAFQNNDTKSSSSSPMLQSVKNEPQITSPDMFSLSNHDEFSRNPSPNLNQQFKEPPLYNFQEFFPSPNLSNNSSIMPSPVMNDETTINDDSESLNTINGNSELLNIYGNSELLNTINGNSESELNPINGEYNNTYNDDLVNMEIYNQSFVNLWQQFIQNNFEINEINEINYLDHPDYNASSLTADLLNQEGLGISYLNSIENA